MSTIIMSACWPLEGMSIAQKAVLISLADNANDHGVCWPSIATIAKRVCASERAVQNAIKWLESVGLVAANRANGRHTSYVVSPDKYTPAANAPPQHVHPSTKCTPAGDAPPQEMHHTPAGDAGDPSSMCGAPPQDMPSNRKEPSIEPTRNRQAARHAPRVALHAEIRNFDLPPSIPFEVWDSWCEHREAKSKDAPWTRAAARISIKKLEKLIVGGQSAEVTVDEAVLRGWTGLFPVKAESLTVAGAPGAVAADWWLSATGYAERGKQLGIFQREGETFPHFKARVVKAAGPGEWMEDMLRQAAKGGETTYNAAFAYFNGIKAPADSDERKAA